MGIIKNCLLMVSLVTVSADNSSANVSGNESVLNSSSNMSTNTSGNKSGMLANESGNESVIAPSSNASMNTSSNESVVAPSSNASVNDSVLLPINKSEMPANHSSNESVIAPSSNASVNDSAVLPINKSLTNKSGMMVENDEVGAGSETTNKSAGTAIDTTASSTASPTASPTSSKVTTMDATFEVADISAVPDDYVENFASNAKAEFASKTNVDANQVEATAVPVVSTKVTFAETVTADDVKTIMVAVSGLNASKVTVTAMTSRRLRRMATASQQAPAAGTVYDVKMEVATTAEAKSVATKSKDTADIVAKAKDAGVTITTPTVTEPIMKVEVKYSVQGEVAAPSAAQLAELGAAMGATATVDPDSVKVTVSSTTPKAGAPAVSSSRPFVFNVAAVAFAITMMMTH